MRERIVSAPDPYQGVVGYGCDVNSVKTLHQNVLICDRAAKFWDGAAMHVDKTQTKCCFQPLPENSTGSFGST